MACSAASSVVRSFTSIPAEGHDHFCAGLIVPEVAVIIRLRVRSFAVVEAMELAGEVVKGSHSLAQPLQEGWPGQALLAERLTCCAHGVCRQLPLPVQHVP